MTAGTPKHGSDESLATPDLERIASLIEGTLDEAERPEVLRLLAESEAAYEVYVESLALLGGTGEREEPDADPVIAPVEPAPAPSPPATGKSDGPATPRFGSAIAARSIEFLFGDFRRGIAILAAAALATIMFVQLQGPGSANRLQLANLADRLQISSAGVLEALSDDPLPSFRSATITGSDEGLAFRLGTRVMELEVAARASLTDQERRRLANIDALVSGLGYNPAVDHAFGTVRANLERPDDPAERGLRDNADASIATWLGGRDDVLLARYDFGKGFQALRFATMGGDGDFVHLAESSPYMDLRGELEIDPATATLLDSLVVATQAATLPEDRDRIVSLMSEIFRMVSN